MICIDSYWQLLLNSVCADAAGKPVITYTFISNKALCDVKCTECK